MSNNKRSKKGVMNQVIGVFILILVISVLAGMTFLFVSSLKGTTQTLTTQTFTITGEYPAWANLSGYSVLQTANTSIILKGSYALTSVYASKNDTKGGYLFPMGLANYSLDHTSGLLTNLSNFNATLNDNLSISYTFTGIGSDNQQAYLGINTTENAGFSVTSYLSLLFLALIFGAVLIVVLRVILPYINLGNNVNAGF